MSHFKKGITSPLHSMLGGYVYIFLIGTILYLAGFYENSTFFSFGLPVTFMGKEINDYPTYIGLMLMLFFHQLVNNWVSSVTYPWIINCVQDPKSTELQYSRGTSMIIINLFAIYSELDVMLIIAGVVSQFVFFLILIAASLVSSTVINWQYVKHNRNYIPI